ncbi:MAG TPA: hypothetical protein P5092_10865 [Ruminococcus sp.]|nr:hypothetical protein [Ruminococcus sp.]
MELLISTKGNKYEVEDKSSGRNLYTVKRKGFGTTRYVLLDTSKYNLYSLVQTSEGQKPTFSLTHNDNRFMNISVKSLFLDPTIIAEGKENYEFISKDRREFRIMHNDKEVGTLKTLLTVGEELQYELTIEQKDFDDYIVLLVVAIDRTFGDMNRPQKN